MRGSGESKSDGRNNEIVTRVIMSLKIQFVSSHIPDSTQSKHGVTNNPA